MLLKNLFVRTPITCTSLNPVHASRVRKRNSRLSLGEWIVWMADSGRSSALKWRDRDYMIFEVAWIHSSSTKWKKSDTSLYQEWERFKGRDEKPRTNKEIKATFRCALRSRKYLKELINERTKDARVWQFTHEFRENYRARCSYSDGFMDNVRSSQDDFLHDDESSSYQTVPDNSPEMQRQDYVNQMLLNNEFMSDLAQYQEQAIQHTTALSADNQGYCEAVDATFLNVSDATFSTFNNMIHTPQLSTIEGNLLTHAEELRSQFSAAVPDECCNPPDNSSDWQNFQEMFSIFENDQTFPQLKNMNKDSFVFPGTEVTDPLEKAVLSMDFIREDFSSGLQTFPGFPAETTRSLPYPSADCLMGVAGHGENSYGVS